MILFFRFSLLETSTNLQKSILSASFLKQPKLCNQLLDKYIEFTALLSNSHAQPLKPLNVTMFETKDFDLTSIDPDCSFKSIEISSIQCQNHILMSNIKILSHIAIEMCNIDTERVTKCTQCILNTFTSANLHIKTSCLRYFTQLFKHTLALDKKIQPMLVWILECIEEIENRIPLWIHHKLCKLEDIELYVTMVNDLLDSQYITKLFEMEYLHQTLNACLKILQTHYNVKVSIYDKIVPYVYALIKMISNETTDESTHTNIYEFVKFTLTNDNEFQKNCELLGPIIVEQMKNGHLESWCLVTKKIQDIFNFNHTVLDTEIIMDHMQCLCSILKTVRFIEHNFTIHLQRETCNKGLESMDIDLTTNLRKVFATHMDSFSTRLLPQLDTLIKHVIQMFSLLLKSKFSPMVDTTTLLIFTEIAVGLLSVYDSCEIDDFLQSQLLLIGFCPLIRCSELLFNHFQQSFEEETIRINRLMETPFIRSNDAMSWQAHVLQMIAGINLKYISTKNKDIFMDILGQICSNLKQSDCLDQIINVLISCVICLNTYSISDFEKFIKSIANNPDNHLVISRHLRWFYCLSSGQTYIFQTNTTNSYPYKVVCPKCDTHHQFNGNDAKILQQLMFDKTNGKFVRTFTTQYNIQDEYHMSYFQLFESSESQIRANMSMCLPSVMNHLDLTRFNNAVNYWLHPIIDDEIDIRLWMIKNMIIFPKCGNEIVLNKCMEHLLKCTKKFLMSEKKEDQSSALQLITSFATSEHITEIMLLNCFRMTIYFCMSCKSTVSRQAVLRATEICYKFGITPKNLLVWYKTEIFKQIVTLCVSNYISYNVGLQKSLQMVSFQNDRHLFAKKFPVVFFSVTIKFNVFVISFQQFSEGWSNVWLYRR